MNRTLTDKERADLEARGYKIPDDVKVTVCPAFTFGIGYAPLDWRGQIKRQVTQAQDAAREKAKKKNAKAAAERAEQFRAAFEANLEPEEIARKLGVARSTVLKRAREMGFRIVEPNGGGKRVKVPEYEIQEMIALRERGWSHQRIGEKLGRDRRTVWSLIRETPKGRPTPERPPRLVGSGGLDQRSGEPYGASVDWQDVE